ncbi:MAG: hypothetical protein O7D30_02860, partial [Rickettsia endosymbiont of Ixodes persulcatus]|nr:hypothetical protein [Rickettsia endosymbiont of Ixodes persulcatus]
MKISFMCLLLARFGRERKWVREKQNQTPSDHDFFPAGSTLGSIQEYLWSLDLVVLFQHEGGKTVKLSRPPADHARTTNHFFFF